jgi:hypothetical protein
VTDWNADSADYLTELGRRPAARPPATIGEIWNAEWTRSGLDTISGIGRPFTESYDELARRDREARRHRSRHARLSQQRQHGRRGRRRICGSRR